MISARDGGIGCVASSRLGSDTPRYEHQLVQLTVPRDTIQYQSVRHANSLASSEYSLHNAGY